MWKLPAFDVGGFSSGFEEIRGVLTRILSKDSLERSLYSRQRNFSQFLKSFSLGLTVLTPSSSPLNNKESTILGHILQSLQI